MTRRTVRTALALALVSSALAVAEPASAQRRTGLSGTWTRPARLLYQDACGWQGSGRTAHLENGSRRMAVTVRASFTVGPNRWIRTTTYHLEPGATQWVGCTRGDSSMEWTTFSIAGARPL